MKIISQTIRPWLWLCAIPFVAQAQFVFTTNNGAITISNCTNAFAFDGTLVIPDTINGLPVVGIDYYACSYKSITNVTIGRNVTNIGPYAFFSCQNLHTVSIPKSVASMGNSAFGACGGGSGGSGIAIFFEGDQPAMGFSVLNAGTMYYLPNTTGWEGADAVLWNPQAQTGDGNFGVRTNQFGFNIVGTADIPIVVEACANFGSVWTPLQSVSLTNGSFHFSDLQWESHPSRLYRIRSP